MGKMRQLRRALRSAVGHPVAYQIQDGRGASLRGVLESVIRGERVTDHDLAFALADDEVAAEQRAEIAAAYAAPLVIPAGKGGKATALVSARGLALYDIEFQPFAFSTLLLGQTITQLANDPEVGMIVIEHDSPGGVATGVPEAADAIFNARKTTKVVSIVNPLSASASYWLASQADEVIAVPSADIGSIGVFMMHAECSRMIDAEGIGVTFIFAGQFKVEGNPFQPLSDEARDFYQSQVDKIYGDFLKAVARGRGVSVQDVRDNFGQGRTFMADQAKRVGMIDRVMPLGSAMQRVGVSLETLEANRRGRRIEAQDRAENIDVPMSDGRGEPQPANAPQFVEIREYVDENTTQWEINILPKDGIATDFPLIKVSDAEAFKAQQREARESVQPRGYGLVGERVYLADDPSAFIYRRDPKTASGVGEVRRVGGEDYIGVDNNSGRVHWQRVTADDGTITFARVNGPPNDWKGLKVFDLDTDQEIKDVIECNTELGYVIRHKRDANGDIVVHQDEVAHEELRGRFKIVRPDDSEAPARNPRHRRLALLRA